MTLKKLFLLSFIFVIVGCAGPGQAGFGGLQASTQTNSVVAAFQQVVAEPAANLADINVTPNDETAPVIELAADSTANVEIEATTNCPTEHFLNVQSANASYAAPQVNITCNTETFTIQSNGIPNFEFVQTTPNDLQAQNYSWEIPLNPQKADQPSTIPLLGTVAVTVNGLPIFGPNEAPTHDLGDPYLDELLDYCNGHTAPGGMYHFHARPDCLFTNLEGNVGLVIGYALDGYPILAPYICEDASCGTVTEVQSSWQRTQDVKTRLGSTRIHRWLRQPRPVQWP